MHALACIAESCPNLEKLVFFSCDFVENFGPANCPSRPLANKPFRKLQVLVCISVSFFKDNFSIQCIRLGPPIIPVYAHPGKSGNKILNPGIPGWFRDLESLNKALVNSPLKNFLLLSKITNMLQLGAFGSSLPWCAYPIVILASRPTHRHPNHPRRAPAGLTSRMTNLKGIPGVYFQKQSKQMVCTLCCLKYYK